MKRAWGDRERVAEVRRAAEAWHDAGAVDEKSLREIEALYPEEKAAPGPVFRALVFFFVTVAVWGIFGTFAVFIKSSSSDTIAALAIVFGVSLAVVTEVLLSTKSYGNGSDAATSFAAALFLLLGFGIFISDSHVGTSDSRARVVLLAATLLFAAASKRWGPWAYAFFSAGALFALLATFSWGRFAWLVMGAALTAVASRFVDRRELPPSHRQAMAALLAAGLLATYAAVNVFSLDHSLLEIRFEGQARAPSGPLHLLAALGTVLLPPAVLLWGVRSRRTLVLDLGILFAALSLVTLRAYVHVAPLWVLLTAGGLLLAGLAIAVGRFLSSGENGERAGFTGEILFGSERRQQALQVAGAVVSFAPSAARVGVESPSGSRFEGGGGDAGGAGASDSF